MGKAIAVLGHYGSGKTEFSVNYAMYLKQQGYKTALLDLDIANPYFRSRERQKMLEEMGISIYFNEYGFDIAEDLPAITAKIRTPLEDESCTTVADIGGNDSGARIMNQFRKYFEPEGTERYLVVNANRFETDTLEGALFHLRHIEEEIGLPITGIVNNTHMLTETTADDILRGYELCQELSRETGIPVVFSTCVTSLLDQLKARTENDPEFRIFPMTLQMRPSWLDVSIG